MLEYFISTHGGRKGQADTALRTADSGYLTRRLVDVSQDVIVRDDDCGTTRGMPKTIAVDDGSGNLVPADGLETAVYARCLAADAVDANGNVVLEANSDLGDEQIRRLIAAGITQIKVRSVLTCAAPEGCCARCYGRSLSTGKLLSLIHI